MSCDLLCFVPGPDSQLGPCICSFPLLARVIAGSCILGTMTSIDRVTASRRSQHARAVIFVTAFLVLVSPFIAGAESALASFTLGLPSLTA